MKISESSYLDAEANHYGYCTRCKTITNFDCVEPDAEDYECDACGSNTVMGMMNALIGGCIEFCEDGQGVQV